MNPAVIIGLITAAIPIIQDAIAAGEAVAADVTAHKTFLQDITDALSKFGAATGTSLPSLLAGLV